VPQALGHRAEPPVVAAPVQHAPEIRREVKLEPAIQAYAPAVATLDPSPPVEQPRVREPVVAAPVRRAPEIRREVKLEPAIQAYAPAVAALDRAAPVEQPRVREEPKLSPPASLAAIPAPAKRSKADEEAAMRRYATEVSRLIGKGVSERDYPRLARDRRWQGTTQLVLRIRADGSLGEVTVATSSGYEILDERALEVVNQIKLPAVPLEIQSRAFAVRIPVRFDLKE
jgi:protein TonB